MSISWLLCKMKQIHYSPLSVGRMWTLQVKNYLLQLLMSNSLLRVILCDLFGCKTIFSDHIHHLTFSLRLSKLLYIQMPAPPIKASEHTNPSSTNQNICTYKSQHHQSKHLYIQIPAPPIKTSVHTNFSSTFYLNNLLFVNLFLSLI